MTNPTPDFSLGGILGKMIGRIFHPDKPKAAPTAPTAAPTTATPTAAPAQRPAEPTSFQPVDVEPVLDGLAAKADQKLNWRTSIVDLMKLLDIDSSRENRTALAHELGYTGDTADSAAMNIWLHKQVMQRVAANGGRVPANLTD